MDFEWKIEAMGAYLTAAVKEDAEGFSAELTGEIVDAPQAGNSDLPERIMGNKPYGPVTVHAPSVGELKQAIEEKVENDIGRIIRWPED